MLTLDSPLEKTFEIWPGLIRLVAAGPDAHAALDAGLDTVRVVAGDLMGDAELLTRNSFDVLPRGLAARRLLEEARGFAQALTNTDMPPLLVALPGAVCDTVLAAICASGGLSFAAVSLGDALAFAALSEGELSQLSVLPTIAGEFISATSHPMREGGVALSGTTRSFPTSGIADLVTVAGGSATLSSFTAAAIGDAMTWPASGMDRRRIVDPLVAQAFAGRTRSLAPGLLPPEDIWDTLSKGVRCAVPLRDKRQFHAAAFALKGRGRIVGPLGGDRLLRFGVSEWR